MKFATLFSVFAFFASAFVHASATEQHGAFVVPDVKFDALYYPTNANKKYGIIVLNGSAGGKNDFMAEKLSNMGHPVLSLAYFDREGNGDIPSSLEMIPLEYFNDAKQWLMNQTDTFDDGVVIYGLSKGAELALVLAANDTDYKGVIATAPSSVVWSGIPAGVKDDYTLAKSSWSLQGQPVHFIPYLHRSEFRTGEPTQMLDWHKASLSRAKNLQQATIKVEHIAGPVLLFSGGKDMAWPSTAMAKTVCARIKNQQCTHVDYPDAPHLLGAKGPDARLKMAEFLALLNTK